MMKYNFALCCFIIMIILSACAVDSNSLSNYQNRKAESEREQQAIQNKLEMEKKEQETLIKSVMTIFIDGYNTNNIEKLRAVFTPVNFEDTFSSNPSMENLQAYKNKLGFVTINNIEYIEFIGVDTIGISANTKTIVVNTKINNLDMQKELHFSKNPSGEWKLQYIN